MHEDAYTVRRLAAESHRDVRTVRAVLRRLAGEENKVAELSVSAVRAAAQRLGIELPASPAPASHLSKAG